MKPVHPRLRNDRIRLRSGQRQSLKVVVFGGGGIEGSDEVVEDDGVEWRQERVQFAPAH